MFGTSATVLTRPDHMRKLLDEMHALDETNRETREMDPQVFRELLHTKATVEEADDADAAEPAALGASPVVVFEDGERVAAPNEIAAERPPQPVDRTSRAPTLPVAPTATPWQAWVLLMLVAILGSVLVVQAT